ncbi:MULTISPECIES: phosphoethanolamine transferase [unclassified Acinetobacter]|uniref:phosphoethanolamine transferase n=1 Tax=unclassified Acinetobacter TaxID=196816 RepID=UPI00190CF233|nr:MULTISPECIES: phosphoethanolamine--lipid A transferase [unclassified Acinetobacter]MBK0063299.1 phosphoethanolamine--lipid A transferase [Acinetobacter sp. S55]MBK0066789.1 phosphoethanolamine--lipid A transferase [Acinetobacter sp. S54]
MLHFLRQVRASLPKVSLACFNLIIALWLALALNFCFFRHVQSLSGFQGWFEWIWLAIVAISLVAYYNLYLQVLNWKWTAKPISIVLIFLGGTTAYFTNQLGAYISPEQIQNVVQTDLAETKQLMTIPFSLWCMGMVVLPIIFVCLIQIEYPLIKKNLLQKAVYIIISFIILLILVLSNYLNFTNIFRQHKDIRQLISPDNVLTSSYKYFHHLHEKHEPLVIFGKDAKMLLPQSDQSKPKLMVLVVGEAARAESFSLNGYSRNTNPKLSQIENLINFSQVTSCGTATAVSVPCMFSGMTREQYDANLAAHREGLLDIAQRAGYKVTWIDNDSGCKGACDRVNNIKISKALKKQYCRDDGFCLDDVLLVSLQRYLASIPHKDKTPQLIILHQRGSHGPAYYNRTTTDFSPFQPTCKTSAIQTCDRQKLINSYDNTIVYTDHILSEIIQSIDKNKHYQSALWYLSDHGESTGENGIYLHGTVYALAPSQQTHIPMLMWFSNDWKMQHDAHIECLKSKQNQVLSQDNLFPTLLSLLDIQSSVINAQLNILNQCQTVLD